MADLMSIGVDPNLWFSNFSTFPWDLPLSQHHHQHQPSHLQLQPLGGSSGLTTSQPGQRYTCDLCNKSYAQYTSLYNHKKFECGKPATLKCPYCPHMTKLKGNLKAHIMNKHSAEVMAQAEKAQAEKKLREKAQNQNMNESTEEMIPTASIINETIETSLSSVNSQNNNVRMDEEYDNDQITDTKNVLNSSSLNFQ